MVSLHLWRLPALLHGGKSDAMLPCLAFLTARLSHRVRVSSDVICSFFNLGKARACLRAT
jgi:hypothetical protein